jgi:DNA-binding NtrC family response regulator
MALSKKMVMASQNVLVVEDEELMRTILRQLLEDSGYSVFTADSSEAGFAVFSQNDIAVTVTDIKLAGADGLTLLDRIKSIDPDALVIVMTAYSSVDTAIAALRKGAYDYITKPFVNADIIQTVKNAINQRQLFKENRALRRELNKTHYPGEIIGGSDKLRSVFNMIEKVADTNANVLILGESGTGKELVARSLHYNSSRAAEPFLAVNCGAMPEHLLESEFFGHVRGSFTGAVSDKKGIFQAASGGTLFLDEVGEMPQPLQVKLLRALQEREVLPVGASVPVKFDARIIAATNKDLEEEISLGNFREDLFYRLSVIEISLPPLRERAEDIPILSKFFVNKTAREQNAADKAITDDALEDLKKYAWPGNVRELENVIERAFILSGDEIGRESLPEKITEMKKDVPDSRSLESFEKRHILEVLDSTGQDKIAAAAILGIDLSTLYRKLKRYDEG